MEIKKRRRWFQFSLRTMIAVTLVASALVWLNLQPRWLGASQPQMITSYCYFEYGWPDALFLQEIGIKTTERLRWESASDANMPANYNFELRELALKEGIGGGTHLFHYRGIVINALTTVALLMAVAFSSEWWARPVASTSSSSPDIS